MTILSAGVARRPITPPTGIYLMGYGARIQPSTGIHDPLFVTTLVLQAGDRRAALLCADICFINRFIVAEVQRQIEARLSIPAEAVVICCSHTHSGPIGYAGPESKPEDRAYVDFLVHQLVESAAEASQSMQPAQLRAGRDEAHININRRERKPDGKIMIGNNPDGPVDHSLQVVQIVTEQDAPLAMVINYACHPVVMGPLNREITADWVGVMRNRVEAELGGLCLFVQGATADVNPRQMRWTADNWDEVTAQGSEVAASVIRAAQTTQPLPADAMSAAQFDVWLPLMPPGYHDVRGFVPQATTLEEAYAKIRDNFPWRVEMEQRGDTVYAPVRVTTLRLGDWALVGLEVEAFTETGWALKAQSPVPVTFVAGYTNGCTGYLPVENVYASGGYEVETAAIFYGLPAGFAKGGAERVTDAALEALKTL